jgi:hypothetical protein
VEGNIKHAEYRAMTFMESTAKDAIVSSTDTLLFVCFGYVAVALLT